MITWLKEKFAEVMLIIRGDIYKCKECSDWHISDRLLAEWGVSVIPDETN